MLLIDNISDKIKIKYSKINKHKVVTGVIYIRTLLWASPFSQVWGGGHNEGMSWF